MTIECSEADMAELSAKIVIDGDAYIGYLRQEEDTRDGKTPSLVDESLIAKSSAHQRTTLPSPPLTPLSQRHLRMRFK